MPSYLFGSNSRPSLGMSVLISHIDGFNPSTMQLCLVNNDPTSTLLITPDGEPMYSVETPPVPHNTAVNAAQYPACARPKSTTTTVKRLNRYHQSTGHVETAIGVVDYQGLDQGTHLQLRGNDLELNSSIPPWKPTRSITDCPEEQEAEEEGGDQENSWEFIGPDSQRYKWQIFFHSPVLTLADNTRTPLARYRRAKLGIVSRSRRAFLEIFPIGIGIIDLIVVTFVGFMKQRVIIDSTPTISTIYENFEHSIPHTVTAPRTAATGTFPPNVTPSMLSQRFGPSLTK